LKSKFLRKKYSFTINDQDRFKDQLLHWSQQYETVIWLDSNNYEQEFSDYDAIMAVDELTCIQCDYKNAFNNLKEYQSSVKDWIFGYFSYDLKNDVENLLSNNFDGLHFPELFFFQPKKIFLVKGDCVEAHYLNLVDEEFEDDLKNIQNIIYDQDDSYDNKIKIKLRIHKDEYFDKVNKILSHIQRGDIYEANFCQEFYSENTSIDPLRTYLSLNQISKPPFATFLKVNDKYLLSASPERYLKKDGQNIISQPIKGTTKRSLIEEEDMQLKYDLEKDEKERSENIMIVDLVRNDISKTAVKGSVNVNELCKVYSFEQVHQMISTISANLIPDIHPIDVIKTTFPMGSMTGAPKISAMKIIERLEETKRGLYSGAVGYITPDGDFDFNVVIRSILYNDKTNYVSYSVGGAITAQSDPLKEYEECLIKAKAMRTVLED
jgi:para-aminobenzoate synthetase component 1